jgi:ubiquinone biosynthesis monooxygenase Coq7
LLVDAPQLPQHRARPSALLPLWSAAAYALGAGSALLGREAAYCVTEAVESVITEHYNDQLRTLAGWRDAGQPDEAQLRAVFRTFRDEEQAHLEEAVRRDAHKAPFYSALSAVVKAGCSAAIFVAKKV